VSVFDLDVRGQANLAETARMNPVLLGDSPAPTFTGMAKGLGMGVMRGGVRAAQLAGMAGGAILSMFERDPSLGPRAVGMYAPGELTDPYFRAVDEYVNNAVDYWTPSPAEVGKAGQILGGLSEIILPLAAGGPALLVGSQEMGHATDLARQGVQAGTALKAGLIEGAASAVGFRLPFLGRTLASRVITGAVGNLALGAGGAAAQHGVLSADGSQELAAQYNPGDVEARAIDVLTGAAFGGLAHLHMRAADREALLTAANAKHFQNDTAPGHPVDIEASVAHQEALETAIEQTLRGEPVSVPVTATQADFIPRERNVSVEARAQGAQDAGIPLEPPPPDVPRGSTPEGTILAEPDLPAALRERAATQAAGEAGSAGAPPVPEAGQPAQAAEQAPRSAAVAAAEQAVTQRDFPVATGETDAAGRPVVRSARELLAEADAGIAKAQNDAKGFHAAVACFLGTG